MRTLRRSFITSFIAGLLMGLSAVGGLFAVASAAASSLGGNFAVAESAHHRRNVEFEADAARSKAEYGQQLARCELVARAERRTCRAEAKFTNAREL